MPQNGNVADEKPSLPLFSHGSAPGPSPTTRPDLDQVGFPGAFEVQTGQSLFGKYFLRG
jgi:hypothetical protein